MSNLRQLSTATLTYASDHFGQFVPRNGASSRYLGGFHDDIGGPDQWGMRWTGYIDGYDFDSDIGHAVLFCPSMGNDGDTWKPAFQPIWRNTDYFYWPTYVPGGGVDWVSTEPIPTGTIATTKPTQPMLGDALFRYRRGLVEWFTVAHAEGGTGGHNSYDTNSPAAPAPAGGHQASADGGVQWYDFSEMSAATHNWGWGADGQDSYQYWAVR